MVQTSLAEFASSKLTLYGFRARDHLAVAPQRSGDLSYYSILRVPRYLAEAGQLKRETDRPDS